MTNKKTKNDIVVSIIMFMLSLIMIFPFFWLFLSAFKTPADVYTYPPKWFPSSYKMDNFIQVFRSIPFGTFYLNTIFTSIIQTVLQIGLSITCAYSLSILEFPGKKVIYMLIQSVMFVPMVVILIPLYMIVSKFHWVNTYMGIIMPQILGVFTTILLVSFFNTIPKDLIEAPKLDGCNYHQILWCMVVPNSTTAISSATLFAFLSHWKSYIWPLLVTNSTKLRTLPVGLKYLIKEASTEYQVMMAAALMSIFPVLLMYILCEKSFVRSLTMTGLKG